MLEGDGHQVDVLHDGIDLPEENSIEITVGPRTDVHLLQVSKHRPVQGLFEIIRSMLDTERYDYVLVEGAFHMSKHLYRLKTDYPQVAIIGTFHISTKLGMSWSHSIEDMIACTRIGVYLDFISEKSLLGFCRGLTDDQAREINKSYLVSNLQPLRYDTSNDVHPEHDRIAYFGRITEQTKKVLTLSKICEERGISLDLYGSIESDLKEYMNEVAGSTYVRYCGQLKQDAVQDKMREYKATVTFSDCEVFGNVVSRSLQLGIPCVVNGDCEGTVEVLERVGINLLGQFIANRTKKRMMYRDWGDSLAVAIGNALATSEEYRSMIRESAIKVLGYESVSRKLLDFYGRVQGK
jgi:glycosyltransferase involved in cell wall biosynthesis